MTYIRKKMIGNQEYFYEQKSVREGDTVKTVHVKYHGKAHPISSGVVPNFFKGISKYMGTTDNISFERFDLSKARLISRGGSDRVVYELPDGKIIKIAKNPRGLEQNDSEGDSYLGMIPVCHENGKDYVVVDKIDRDDSRTNKMLKGLSGFSPIDFDKKTSPLIDAFSKLDEKYPDSGFNDSLSYDLIFNDFKSPRNWGWKDDKPYLVDAGTLNKSIIDKSVSEFSKKDWSDVLNARRRARKKGIVIIQ